MPQVSPYTVNPQGVMWTQRPTADFHLDDVVSRRFVEERADQIFTSKLADLTNGVGTDLLTTNGGVNITTSFTTTQTNFTNNQSLITKKYCDDKIVVVNGTITTLTNTVNLKANAADVYTEAEVNALLANKADVSTTYTKSSATADLALKANQATTYTKTETDSRLALKADASVTYTETEVNNLLALKADKSTTYTKVEVDGGLAMRYLKTEVDTLLDGRAAVGNVYTKAETDTKLSLKANQATTYTKTEVDGGLALRYLKTETFSKAEADARFEPINSAYTKEEGDAKYATIATTYTKTQADASLALKADKTVTYTKTEVDSIFASAQVPSNYYADLNKRLVVDADQIRRTNLIIAAAATGQQSHLALINFEKTAGWGMTYEPSNGGLLLRKGKDIGSPSVMDFMSNGQIIVNSSQQYGGTGWGSNGIFVINSNADAGITLRNTIAGANRDWNIVQFTGGELAFTTNTRAVAITQATAVDATQMTINSSGNMVVRGDVAATSITTYNQVMRHGIDGRIHMIAKRTTDGQAEGYIYRDIQCSLAGRESWRGWRFNNGILGGPEYHMTTAGLRCEGTVTDNGAFNVSAVRGSAGGGLRVQDAAGGSWDSWQSRPAAVLLDHQNAEVAAASVWKVTKWGVAHLACLDIHYPTGGLVYCRTMVGGYGFMMHSNGQFNCGSLVQTSDVRVKEDFKPIESPLAKLQLINGKQYYHKLSKNIKYGCIAQEVEAVLPHAVEEDATNTIPDTEDKIKVLDYNAVIALLVESVKELKAEVDALRGFK